MGEHHQLWIDACIMKDNVVLKLCTEILCERRDSRHPLHNPIDSVSRLVIRGNNVIPGTYASIKCTSLLARGRKEEKKPRGFW